MTQKMNNSSYSILLNSVCRIVSAALTSALLVSCSEPEVEVCIDECAQNRVIRCGEDTLERCYQCSLDESQQAICQEPSRTFSGSINMPMREFTSDGALWAFPEQRPIDGLKVTLLENEIEIDSVMTDDNGEYVLMADDNSNSSDYKIFFHSLSRKHGAAFLDCQENCLPSFSLRCKRSFTFRLNYKRRFHITTVFGFLVVGAMSVYAVPAHQPVRCSLRPPPPFWLPSTVTTPIFFKTSLPMR